MQQGEKGNETKKHPTFLEPLSMLLIIGTSILGAVIGLQLITTLGVSPNTSIIGALIAMVIARIPLQYFKKYRSIHRQNLVQTSISTATFAAANSLLLPIGIPFVLGKQELIMPMMVGATLALLVDGFMMYKLFDSKIFPAKETWAPGVATAEAIIAGDQGGKRAGLLGIGTGIGLIGSFFHVPMAAFGTAFIGNIWALTMFGVGLLLRGYSVPLFGTDLNELYIPHGFMIGAGLVALVQVSFIIFKKEKKQDSSALEKESFTRSAKETKRTLILGYFVYMIIALILALLGGLMTEMSPGMLIGFLVYAAFAAFVHELIVGIAAMHSGWFPAFAVALITLIIGILIGFPPVALALLVGFSASTGPAFADMAFDLKSGYILRGKGEDIDFEKQGRKHQFYTSLIAFAVAVIMVLVAYKGYFAKDLVPPVDRVYAATIEAGISGDIALKMFLWAIPGAILQFIGGAQRQIGVLFATGLLIFNINAGWAVLLGILIRLIVLKVKGKEAETSMNIMAAGFIAGDALYNFFNSIWQLRK